MKRKKAVLYGMGIIMLLVMSYFIVAFIVSTINERNREFNEHLAEDQAKADAYWAEYFRRDAEFRGSVFRSVAPMFNHSLVINTTDAPSAGDGILYFFVDWGYNDTTDGDLRNNSIVKSFVKHTTSHNVTFVWFNKLYPYLKWHVYEVDEPRWKGNGAGYWCVYANNPAFSFVDGTWIYVLMFVPHLGL